MSPATRYINISKTPISRRTRPPSASRRAFWTSTAPLIASWPEEDAKNWHKERRTAKRILKRLVEEESALFVEDKVTLIGPHGQPFDVARYEVRRAGKLGRVRLESNRIYSLVPELALT